MVSLANCPIAFGSSPLSCLLRHAQKERPLINLFYVPDQELYKFENSRRLMKMSVVLNIFSLCEMVTANI